MWERMAVPHVLSGDLPEAVRQNPEFGAAHVQNSLEVLGRIDHPDAHAAVISGLDHPRDVIRGNALRALSQGAAWPEDFDRL